MGAHPGGEQPQVMLWLRRSFAGAFALLGSELALAERYFAVERGLLSGRKTKRRAARRRT
jgi:hypothetical protein